MTSFRQYYGGDGVPIGVPIAPGEAAAAWRSQRRRFYDWFAALPDDGWGSPTRCAGWNTVELARHLVSAAQFLGYTLHESNKGNATRLLEGFDSQATPGNAAAQFASLAPAAVLDEWRHTDARVEAELEACADNGWRATAEAPPGHLAAHLAVAHFLFDSWVHERDVMQPAGEVAPVDDGEARVVMGYVLALAGLAAADTDDAPHRLQVHAPDIDGRFTVRLTEENSVVVDESATDDANLTGAARDVVDVATGRVPVASVVEDGDATAFLRGLVRRMR